MKLNNTYTIGLLLAASAALAGCAGSANHEVVTAYNASDEGMNCQQISAEQVRVQSIINAVNQDKSDVTGKDLLDGILWFPFNLIAKNSNYNDSLNAANVRLTRLDSLRQNKGCTDAEYAVEEQKIKNRLDELDTLKANKSISEEEYKEARKAVLTKG